jgi:hypothetical protein
MNYWKEEGTKREGRRRKGGEGRGGGERERGRRNLLTLPQVILCILSSFISSIAFNGYKY